MAKIIIDCTDNSDLLLINRGKSGEVSIDELIRQRKYQNAFQRIFGCLAVIQDEIHNIECDELGNDIFEGYLRLRRGSRRMSKHFLGKYDFEYEPRQFRTGDITDTKFKSIIDHYEYYIGGDDLDGEVITDGYDISDKSYPFPIKKEQFKKEQLELFD